MAEETTSSPPTGATPPSGPATGNNTAPSGATPEKPALTVDELLKRVTDLEHSHKNASEELERHRKNAKRFAELEKAEAERQQAQMSELEKAQKQAADLQQQQEALAAELYEARVRQDVADLMGKFNFIRGLSAKAIANLLLVDDDAIEFEGGKPTNIEKLLEKLVKAEPGLVEPQGGTPGQPGTPALPAMNPGRSSITQPGGNVPGKIPRLDDIQWTR